MTLPLVSIITPSYNSREFIQQTIESVLAQTYPHIEYIIMDGASQDGTLDILRAYEGRLHYVSQKDGGQADAINQGWRRSRGEILAWLCADDLYHPDTVERAVAALQAHPEVAWIYGREQRLDRQGQPYPFRHWFHEWDYGALLHYGNFISQPTVFLRRGVWESAGELRVDLFYTMDYEYWLRIGQAHPAHFVNEQLALVHHYPETKSASGGLKRLAEIQAVLAAYGQNELPHSFRHDWTRLYVNQSWAELRQGHWRGAGDYARRAGRYPKHLPRALLKNLVGLLPHEAERRLRLWWIDPEQNRPRV
jgi:glycosyltransferase involved in cell wall biosynthesis